MRRPRRLPVAGCCAAAAVLLLLLPVGAADGARLVTWGHTESRFVNPADAVFNSLPSGVTGPSPARLPVNVYLPDGYDGRRRFPLLVLLHGHGDSYAAWAAPSNGDLLDTARGLRAIVVMPEADQGWYANWWNAGTRGAPAWESYHLDELLPLVERRLRVRPGRRWHAIAGLSMGGEGAMFYASQRPGYFGSVASFSGALWTSAPFWPLAMGTQGQSYRQVFGDPVEQRFYTLGHDPSALVANLRSTRVFVTSGDGTPLTPADRSDIGAQTAERVVRQLNDHFVAVARGARLALTWLPRKGVHSWPYWRAGLRNAIRWGLFGPVAEQPRSWSLRTVARTGDAWGYRFAFTRPPSVVETFSLSGCVFSATGRGTVRVDPPRGRSFTGTLPFRRRCASSLTG